MQETQETIRGLRRSPGEGSGNLPGESHGAEEPYTVHSAAKSQARLKRLSTQGDTVMDQRFEFHQNVSVKALTIVVAVSGDGNFEEVIYV